MPLQSRVTSFQYPPGNSSGKKGLPSQPGLQSEPFQTHRRASWETRHESCTPASALTLSKVIDEGCRWADLGPELGPASCRPLPPPFPSPSLPFFLPSFHEGRMFHKQGGPQGPGRAGTTLEQADRVPCLQGASSFILGGVVLTGNYRNALGVRV